jgi:hypothetical protein
VVPLKFTWGPGLFLLLYSITMMLISFIIYSIQSK